MAEKSRTEYSARNTTVAMAARVIAILAGYLTRVVFTHTLSEDYVGINGLFTDILNVLALSELGVETAITYALYKPIAQGDVEKQKSLMRLYRTFYRIVACVVLVLGLLVIPFLDVLIRDQPQVDHLILIYLMYLFSSVVSYLLVYKRTLVDAHQLSYIGVLYKTAFLILQNVLQIAVLLLTRDFLLFLSVMILCTIGSNLAISAKADKLYPYLREKDVRPLSRAERQEIYRNVRAMLMHKVGNVLVNNTDNLLLSSLVGTLSVGRYSNYFLIIGSVRQVLNQMFQGITASVGNLGVEESKERIRKIFEASFFIGQWMFGLAAICLFQAADPFVEFSFGAQYVFPRDVTLVLCLNFYLTGMRQPSLVFRDSMGVFWYDRYKAIPEAVINLVASLILGRSLGTVGIFLGTLISTVTTSLWVEPYVFYKYRLKASSRPYFLRYALYASVTFLLWWAEDLVCRRIGGGPMRVCVLRVLLCFAVTNLAYLLLYHRTREFRLLMRKAGELLGRRRAPGKERGGLSAEEECLLRLLREELKGAPGQGHVEPSQLLAGIGKGEGNGESGSADPSAEGASSDPDVDWEEVCRLAERHGVLALLYRPLAESERVPGKIRERAEDAARMTAQRSYRLLFLCKYLIGRLKEARVTAIVLKGVGTASYYPVPELRKTGDVDLLVPKEEELDGAKEALLSCGLAISDEQTALHHISFRTGDGKIEVELHTMLAEPFDNPDVNRYLAARLRDCGGQIRMADSMGVTLPVLDVAYHGYELLLHMLQHFLRAGFGIRFLCDWTVFWDRDVPEGERKKYLALVRESGVKGFSDMITLCCRAYLGLPGERVEWMGIDGEYDIGDFLREVLDAEEFGKSAADRMVALRGDSLSAYLIEFHHQMHLNFPRAGRVFLLWPALWAVTLARFLRNNRRVRGVSARQILKKAGERSRMMEQLDLWKTR